MKDVGYFKNPMEAEGHAPTFELLDNKFVILLVMVKSDCWHDEVQRISCVSWNCFPNLNFSVTQT